MKKKNIVIICLSVALIVSFTANIILAFGNSNKLAQKNICGQSDVEKFNEIIDNESFDKDSLKNLAAEISDRKNNRNDINCVFVSFVNNQTQDKTDEMKTDFEQIKKLSDDYSISQKFNSVYSLREMESLTLIDHRSEGGKG